MRNPDTGRRVSRPNDPDACQVADIPHLRIVDDELVAVQEARGIRTKNRLSTTRRPPHLLSGLIFCAECGGGITVKDRDTTVKTRVRCSTVGGSGTCSNRRVFYLNTVEAAVVDGMREQLRDPRLIEIYVRRYNETRRKLASTASRDRAKLEARVAAAQREHDRVLTG